LIKYFNSNVKVIFAGICSTLIAIGFGRFIYTPILPSMQNDLNLSSTAMGIIASYNYFGYLIGSILPIFWRIDYLKNVIISSSVISVTTIYLMGNTTDLKIFIFLRFLCGVTSALGFIFTISFMFNFFKDSKNKTLQLYHFCGIGLGIVIGTIFVWIASTADFFWHHQWMFIGFVGMLLCIPLILFIPNKLVSMRDTNISKKNKFKINFITISFGYFFFGIGYIIFGTFISAITRDSFEISSYQYFYWIIVGIFAIPSVLFWDWLSKKISPDFLLFSSCFTCSLGVSFLIFESNLNLFLLSCLLYGFGVPGSVALILVEGKKRFVGNISISVAIMTSAFSVGQILGPYISGILIDIEDEYKSSIILALVCLVLSSFLMIDPKRLRIFNS